MGQSISWEHICQLYQRNLGSSDNVGVSMVHKLTLEHINLTSFSKMRVNLAAQVSETDYLHFYYQLVLIYVIFLYR